MYRLGMTLSSSQYVETHRDEFVSILTRMAAWDEWSSAQRVQVLTEYATLLFQIRDIHPKPGEDLPTATIPVVEQWLSGMQSAEIALRPDIQPHFDDAAAVGVFIENVCGYRLPWGANSIMAYVADYLAEQ